jgi:broad specificity phosphatase PhoE
MKVFFIRHGESLPREGRSDADMIKVGLSPLGKLQAAAAGKALRAEGIDVIFSSPIARAKETADIIGGILRLPVNVDERLWEFMADLDSVNKQHLHGLKVQTYRDPDFVPPSGESLTSATTRFLSMVSELEKKGHENIAIVSHRIVMEQVFARLCHYREGEHEYLKNASISMLEITPGERPELRYANKTHKDMRLFLVLLFRRFQSA